MYAVAALRVWKVSVWIVRGGMLLYILSVTVLFHHLLGVGPHPRIGGERGGFCTFVCVWSTSEYQVIFKLVANRLSM